MKQAADRCPHCGSAINAPEAYFGRRVACKKCGKAFILSKPADKPPRASKLKAVRPRKLPGDHAPVKTADLPDLSARQPLASRVRAAQRQKTKNGLIVAAAVGVLALIGVVALLLARHAADPDRKDVDLTSAAVEIGEQVGAKCVLDQATLGMEFNAVRGPGSVHLEITNGSDVGLSVGSDLFVRVEGGDNVGAVVMSDDTLDEDEEWAFMYASETELFTSAENGRLRRWVYRRGKVRVDPRKRVTKSYKGTWPRKVRAGATVTIEQRLVTWPGSDRGWAATPVLSVADGPEFRLLLRLGAEPEEGPIVLPITVGGLEEFVTDPERPLVLRKWAAGWLASFPGNRGWRRAAALLEWAALETKVRMALARWLATHGPVRALAAVNAVLWDQSSSDELQWVCYVALTKSRHVLAQELLRGARKHPNGKIRGRVTRKK